MKILLVEDDERLSRFIDRGLSEEGHAVVVRADGYDAEDQILFEPYDVVILDLMLPGQSGIEVLRHIRATGVNTPVLILTARDRLEDKVRGLEAGADDYLTKPFQFEELLARLRALARRGQTIAPSVLRFGPIEVDTAKRHATCDGHDMPLTHLEFALLEYMVRHGGEVLSRACLEQHVWGDDYDRGTNVVAVYINYLRKKLNAHGMGNLIETVRGSGYRLRSER